MATPTCAGGVEQLRQEEHQHHIDDADRQGGGDIEAEQDRRNGGPWNVLSPTTKLRMVVSRMPIRIAPLTLR
ncbi:hypothetical protein CF70_024515 [Cupriavidus sp. SK-3]|nr:hypothetical protein CF70_024515 [Cupriavidus sp. SK-3]